MIEFVRFRIIEVLLFLFLVLGCSGEVREDRYNLLIITIDTTRADRIGAYGCVDIETPSIDGLAERGVLFSRAYSPVPLTLPSHSSIMTGLYPPGHGVRNNGNYRLPVGIKTMAEVFSEAGYSTAAFIGAFVLDSQFGLDQGFHLYHDSFLEIDRETRSFEYAERGAGEVTELAVEWLSRTSDPFLLWVHYFDPHHPYNAPEAFRDRYPGDPYLGEIAYTYHNIGLLLEALENRNKLENTLVVLTSDHGESLGEHQELSHGIFLYEASMRIPLILVLEGVLPSGHSVEGYVSLTDIFPTVCDIMGVIVPEEVHGRSLLNLIRGAETGDVPIYMESLYPFENFGWSPITGVLSSGLKYLRAPEPELYNVEADPHELTNLAQHEKRRIVVLETLLGDLERRYSSSASGKAVSGMDEKTRRRLESLGYVWSQEKAGTAVKVDPKSKIEIVSEVDWGMRLFNKGQKHEAALLFEKILESDPGNVTAHNILGMILSDAGDQNGAIQHWRQVLELNPGYLETYRNLGTVLRERGDLGEAVNILQKALDLNPQYTKAHVDLGLTFQKQGDVSRARKSFSRALELEPNFLQAHIFLGTILKEEGILDSAYRHISYVLSRDSSNVEVRRQAAQILIDAGDVGAAVDLFCHVAEVEGDISFLVELGIALDRSGDREEAVQIYRKAAAVDSTSPEVHNNLGIALFGLDHFDEAESSFKKAILLEENYAEPYFNLGNLYRKTGRDVEAVRSYRGFLEVWQGGENVRQRVVELIERLEAPG